MPDYYRALWAADLQVSTANFLKHPERRRAVAADLQRAACRYTPDVVVRRITAVLDGL